MTEARFLLRSNASASLVVRVVSCRAWARVLARNLLPWVRGEAHRTSFLFESGSVSKTHRRPRSISPNWEAKDGRGRRMPLRCLTAYSTENTAASPCPFAPIYCHFAPRVRKIFSDRGIAAEIRGAMAGEELESLRDGWRRGCGTGLGSAWMCPVLIVCDFRNAGWNVPFIQVV